MSRVSAAKAWVGASLAAAAAASGALAENGRFSWGDICVIIGAFVAGYQGVYWTPRIRGSKAQTTNDNGRNS
jgi:ABC-type sugar transport system substrate-binding protein